MEFGDEILVAGEAVAQVGQPGMLRAYPAADLYGLLQTPVGVVRAAFYRIDYEMLKAFELGELLLGDVVHVGAVGYVAETETENGEGAVHAPYRDDRRFADNAVGISRNFVVAPAGLPFQMRKRVVETDLERLGSNVVDMPLRGAGVFVLSESVGILHPERILDIFLAVDVAGTALRVVQRSYVIQSASMVLVIVGQQDSVEMAHPCAEHLCPEVRAGVHEYCHPFMLHKHAGAQSLVHRIRAAADFALTAYHGNALRGAAAEKRQPCTRLCILFIHLSNCFVALYSMP